MRERFLLAFIVMLASVWLLGLFNVFPALAGPFIAGFTFVRFKAGVRKRSIASGAVVSGGAVALMTVPMLLVGWFLAAATGDPGESENLADALLNLQGLDPHDIVLTAYFVVLAITLGATGGAAAA